MHYKMQEANIFPKHLNKDNKRREQISAHGVVVVYKKEMADRANLHFRSIFSRPDESFDNMPTCDGTNSITISLEGIIELSLRLRPKKLPGPIISRRRS